MISLRRSIISTVAYADVFDYPLTGAEISLWMVGKTVSKREVKHALVTLAQGQVRAGQARFYHFTKRSGLVVLRQRRMVWSREKWKKANTVAWWFRFIPTVLLVGVTGGLSMNNAKKDDDIDIFIITRPECLWISRFLVTLLTDLVTRRRRPGEQEVPDSICLNMFMTTQSLTIPKNEQDLYSAHEVLQMKPVWERENAYGQFLTANSWVKKFLPNTWEEKCQMIHGKWPIETNNLALSIGHLALRFLEIPSRAIQLWYMRKRRTTETITDTLLRFHPHDVRGWVCEEIGKRLRRHNIPLDKVFYGR